MLCNGVKAVIFSKYIWQMCVLNFLSSTYEYPIDSCPVEQEMKEFRKDCFSLMPDFWNYSISKTYYQVTTIYQRTSTS